MFLISMLAEQSALMKVLNQPHVLVGIGLAMIGIAVAVLAKRIARAIRKTAELTEDDKIVLTLKSVGLVFALVALILVAWGSNIVL